MKPKQYISSIQIKIIFLPFLALFSSCQEPSFYQILVGADSMTIYFYPNEKQQDTITVKLTQLPPMKEFMQTVSDKKQDENCQKVGKVIFHKVRAKEDIMSAEFSLNENCREIIYSYNNQKYSRELSKYNYEFLLSAQANWKLLQELKEIEK